MIINAGIKKLVYSGSYPDELAQQMLKDSQLKVERFEKRG